MIAISAELGSSVVTNRRALCHVVSHHAEHAPEALVGQLRVAADGRSVPHQPGLIADAGIEVPEFR